MKELELQREQYSYFSKLARNWVPAWLDLIPVSENYMNLIHLFFRWLTGSCTNTVEDCVREEAMHIAFQDWRPLDTQISKPLLKLKMQSHTTLSKSCSLLGKLHASAESVILQRNHISK